MSDLKFADTHNLVAFLPTKSGGFEEIVDFLNANPIKYALTVNPTIYCSCVKQLWDTVNAKTVNREVQLQALVDKKKGEGKGFSRRVTPLFQTMMLQAHEEMGEDENVPTTSNDPLLSGEDRLKLTKLMDLCTNLQKKVLDLEKANTAQDSEVASLKKKIKKLERRNKSRTLGLKRLRKVGSARRVDSSNEASLGDQEDASKQGRKIADIDADAGVLDEQEVEVEKVVSTAEVTTKSATTTVNELTLAQTLIEIKAAKPKSKKPLKKKDHIMYDQEVALNLQAQLQAELEEEERLTRQKEEESNIALIESWDNTQAMMDADYQMAQQLQA
ncbi:hypothetical protein Tco_0893469 [Tanacetum coccineum]|uniref:Xylulose kinase-1 n=1 Tax=Tanacetum coccineum TaxID=301880 RepID=A0ABQ5CBQ5_9ASTR